MKNAPAAQSNESARDKRKFYTNNPRVFRALALLLQRPITREELDARAGCSNGPALVAELRRCGLELPCKRVKGIDRDGRICCYGVYCLTKSDRYKVMEWMKGRQQVGYVQRAAFAQELPGISA